MLSPLVRVDVWASHEAVEATQRRERRQRGRRSWRAGGREAEECPRKTTRSFAACGHDRRSPPVESQGDGRMRTGTGPETTSRSRSSSARHDRADSSDEARRSSAHRTRSMCLLVATEDGQMVGFDAVLSLTQLSANRRPTTCQMVAEHSGRPNGLRGRGELSWDRRREIVEVLYMVSRVSKPSSRWKASHIARNAYPFSDTAFDRVHTQRQSNRSACVPVRSRMRKVASIL